jgi:hypothetical protein
MEMSSELLKFNLTTEQETFIVKTLGGYFQQLAQQPKVVVESLAAISFFTDIIEFASDSGRAAYFEMTYKVVMEELTKMTYTDNDYV